jgi:hypothetical protein
VRPEGRTGVQQGDDDGEGVVHNVVLSDVNISGSTITFSDLAREISEVDPDDIQEVAASQLKLLEPFYRTVLAQAQQSFRFALIGVGVGLGFFIVAIAFLLLSSANEVATISAVAGALVQVIAGINFVLYGKATEQLGSFHVRLERTQRILLANSITASIEGEARDATRSQLVVALVQNSGAGGSDEIDK